MLCSTRYKIGEVHYNDSHELWVNMVNVKHIYLLCTNLFLLFSFLFPFEDCVFWFWLRDSNFEIMRFNWAIVSELSTKIPSLDVAVVLLLVETAFVEGVDVAMLRFWLLIEDSRISLASSAWSRNREAPSCPPNY